MSLAAIRNTPPTDADWLWDWVYNFTGVKIARSAVCPGHDAPFDAFAHQVLRRPRVALWLGSRGSGKSFLSAIDTHIASRFHPNHGTRILGGSQAQSRQIYDALRQAIQDGRGPLGSDGGAIDRLLKREASYRNGSAIEILACSDTSVRGPHVPALKLDEVDEIDPEHRQSAMGMNMEVSNCDGVSASCLMTSTWHRVAGPMAELVEKGASGAYPLYRFCVFEVLERCSASRSGRPTGGPDLYENCPACPLKPWCHAHVAPGLDGNPLPKAKRSSGHYRIESLIQKIDTVSLRVFEADYLCAGPRADGVWFKHFNDTKHVTPSAEYDPRVPVHVSIDSGVVTGAVWAQVKALAVGGFAVNVFGDYLAEGLPARANAAAIMERGRKLHGDSVNPRVSTDPAGNSRNAIGPTVIGEYKAAGLRGRNGIEHWPLGLVADGLETIESLLSPASGNVRLTIHPRCTHLIAAFRSYLRAKRTKQWMDYPADPQHPHEDVMDPLRGLLKVEFPKGLVGGRSIITTGGEPHSDLYATARDR